MSVIKNGVVHLVGDGTWPWIDPVIGGDDIVVRAVHATSWGDPQDKMDSGITASSKSTRDNPHALWCALPMNFGAVVPETEGSPLPKLPWGTLVGVFFHKTGLHIITELEDLGPAKRTKHAIDLTDGVWLAGGVDLADGVTLVDYRVIHGARHVKG